MGGVEHMAVEQCESGGGEWSLGVRTAGHEGVERRTPTCPLFYLFFETVSHYVALLGLQLAV